MPQQTKPCDVCGKLFESWESAKRRFCGMRCRNVAQSVRLKLSHPASLVKPTRGEINPCELCGKPVYRNASQKAQNVMRFCSADCANVHKARNRIAKKCVACGKEFSSPPSQYAVRHCSRQCWGDARTRRPLDRFHNGKPARMDDKGYVMVYEPSHPNKSFSGWQYEHRLVVEKAIGRYLQTHEAVHHVNEIKDDNRLENLEVMDAIAHAVLSGKDYRSKVTQAFTDLEEYKKRFGAL